MAKYTSNDFREDGMPSANSAGGTKCVRAEYTFTSAVTLASGDIIELCKVPPGHAIADMAIDIDALGTSSAVAVGTLTADSSDLAATGINSATAAAGGYARMNNVSAMRAAVTETDHLPVGIKVTTAATAALSVGAKVGLTIWYRATRNGK